MGVYIYRTSEILKMVSCFSARFPIIVQFQNRKNSVVEAYFIRKCEFFMRMFDMSLPVYFSINLKISCGFKVTSCGYKRLSPVLLLNSKNNFNYLPNKNQTQRSDHPTRILFSPNKFHMNFLSQQQILRRISVS